MMTVKFENKNDYGVVYIEGECNIISNAELKNAFNDIFNANQHKLIIDFSKTTYIDSSAISVIITARNTVVSKSGTIVFCSLPQTIEKVFNIIGFKGVVKFFKTQEEAVAFMKTGK